MNREKKSTLYILLGSSFWAISGSFAQYLFHRYQIPASLLVSIRLTLSGLIMLLYLAIKDRGKIFRVFHESIDTCSVLVFALFGMMCCQFSYFRAIASSNVATATVLQFLGPVFIMLYTLLRFREKPDRREILALLSAVSGVFIITTHFSLKTLVLSKDGLFWGIMSGICLAVYTIQPKRILRKFPKLLVIGWGMFFAGIALLMLTRPELKNIPFDPVFLGSLFIIIFFGTILAFSMYLSGVSVLGATKGSLLSAVEPLVATVISVVFLNNILTFSDVFGSILIISTVFLLTRKQPVDKS